LLSHPLAGEPDPEGQVEGRPWTLSGDAFELILEIEDGHTAPVRAEQPEKLPGEGRCR
jgi:hypothetical protein